MMIMESFVWDHTKKIAALAVELAETNFKAKIPTSREVQSAVRLILAGNELAKQCVMQGTKAVTAYRATASNPPDPLQTKTSKAGLLFPVGRIHRILKELSRTKVGLGASIYLCAVLEYLVGQIIDAAGNAATQNHRIRIVPRHIVLAVRHDEDLDFLLKDVTISSGGIVPAIHPYLLPAGQRPDEEEEKEPQQF